MTPPGGKKEFFHQEAGEKGRIVANDAVFFQEIVGKKTNLPFEDFVAIDNNGLGALGAIAAAHIPGNAFAIGDNRVDDAAGNVVIDGAEMVAEGVASGLAGLSHEVGNVGARGLGAKDGPCDFRDKKIGNDAGVERAGAHENEVRLLNGFDGRGKRADTARIQFQFANRKPAARDAGFTVDALAIAEGCDEMHVGNGGRKDAPADGEDFAGNPHGFSEVTGDMGQGSEEEIAEIVAAEAPAGMKTILEETAEKGFVLGEGDHAVADVTGRKHAIFAAEPAGTATVIGNRDDGGEVGDRALGGRVLVAASNDKFLQAAEERGEAGTTAKSNNAQAARRVFFRSRSLHVKL